MQKGLRVITLQRAIEKSPILLSQYWKNEWLYGTIINSYFGGSNNIFADCTDRKLKMNLNSPYFYIIPGDDKAAVRINAVRTKLDIRLKEMMVFQFLFFWCLIVIQFHNLEYVFIQQFKKFSFGINYNFLFSMFFTTKYCLEIQALKFKRFLWFSK